MKRRLRFTSIFLALMLIFNFVVACSGREVISVNDESTGSATIERLNQDSGVINIIYNGARSLDFGKDWKFVLVNPEGVKDPTGEYENTKNPAYDDSTWRILDIPHDWSIELIPAPEKSAGADYSNGFFQGGLGWYRKTFTLPTSMNGKKISVEFDGVYMDSSVFMNGELLGNHPYGYTGFSFNLTNLAHTDGVTPNVIAVKVQNPVPSSRWYSGSGIYRNVRLIVTEDIYVERWGTTITTSDLENTIRKNYANVYIKTGIINESSEEETVELISRILDANGNVVSQSISEASGIGQSHTFEENIELKDPVLWSFDNPYLYTLESRLNVDGNIVDEYTTTFGIRYFKIDPDEGFSLNGKYSKIQGVNLHHDLGALGAAVNYDAIVRQLEIMKRMGVNAIRTAHNPPAPELIQATDRLGMVVMVEAFDCWQMGKNFFDYGRFFNDNSEDDIKEMVNAAKNSPSVIIWSIGNEIWNPDIETAQKLIDAIKSIDTTRPIVWGSDGYRSVPDNNSPHHRILLMLDGLGLNYNTAKSVDELHAKYPDKFIFESESSSSTSTRGIYQEPDNLNTGENYTPGKMGASSYDNNMASWTMPGEYGLKKDRDRKFFTGQFLWSGIDYIGEPTPYYDVFPVKSSFFGAVDTAGFPKDLYYLFKSQWTSEPMVHLLPMNWTDYEHGEEVRVWAYSNVETVELFLNGKSIGIRTFNKKVTLDGRTYLETTEATHDDKTINSGPYPGSYTSPDGSTGKLHLAWNILFEPGTLVAVATKNGREVARDEMKTAGEPYEIRLMPDKKVIAADGKSLSFITVEIIDSKGVIVPGADNTINFEVTGGMIAGVDNGRQESAESYKAPHREAFNGKALLIVQASETSSPITITATSQGLLPARTTVYSVKETDPDKLIAFEHLYIRTRRGSTPILPRTVQGIYPDGTQEQFQVEWDELDGRINVECGIYRIKGRVNGEDIPAEALITVYDVGGVESYSTAMPAGTAPVLPATVRLVYNDGVDQFVSVIWDPIEKEEYTSTGIFTVNGTVEGSNIKALASIRVTEDFVTSQNIAESGNPLVPVTDASYSGDRYTIPAAMIDGDKTSGGWSNYYEKQATVLLPAFSKARERDWAKVSWPNPQKLDNLKLYFNISRNKSLPASIRILYWNGANFEPVNNAIIKWAVESNKVTTVTFDPVITSQIKIEMASRFPGEKNGFLQISELEITGDIVTYNKIASLEDLKINGQTVTGFKSDITEYEVSIVKKVPEISATAAGNGRIAVISPLTLPGRAIINVISEDGLTHKTYKIDFILDD